MRDNILQSINGCDTPHQLLECITNLTEDNKGLRPFSTFSPAIHDTAWLSMVHHTSNDGSVEWLFPECFRYILKTQLESGAWPSYASPIDGILNTASSLLALVRREAIGSVDTNEGLSDRIQRAKSSLGGLLETWDVAKTVHVGFEILVPRLLDQLTKHEITFSFPGQEALQLLHEQKMRRFKPQILYAPVQTTPLHSLEALVGYPGFDFNKVSHHCDDKERFGILGSPAATAAYLSQVEEWDLRAEAYLRSVVGAYPDGVPSAFPTETFEFSWVGHPTLDKVMKLRQQALSTIISRLIAVDDVPQETLEKLRRCLLNVYESQSGLVGFTQGILPDADDTARLILSLQHLGVDVDLSPLLRHFETETHFRTYEMEGSASFSANCNVLLAILASGSTSQYTASMEKILIFLLDQWVSGKLTDKWNLDENYLHLIFSEALTGVLQKWDLAGPKSADLTKQRLVVVLSQLLSRVVTRQMGDGSWGDSTDGTAYAVLTIAQCLVCPWSDATRNRLIQSIRRGQDYLAGFNKGVSEPLEYTWIEKVSYSSELLSKCYSVCALNVPFSVDDWSDTIVKLFSPPASPKIEKLRRLLSLTPLFNKDGSLDLFDQIVLEAMHHGKRLRNQSRNIFPRDTMPMTKDDYVELIPIFWVACNHLGAGVLFEDLVWDMCILSLLNYQADEYMETIVASLYTADINALRKKLEARSNTLAVSWETPAQASNGEVTNGDIFPQAAEAYKVLERYILFVVEHPRIQQAPPHIRRQLSVEVFRFLEAHIQHNQDNRSLRDSRKDSGTGTPSDYGSASEDDTPARTFFDWVTTTGADDTSCPFSFLFFSCLISPSSAHCFSGSAQARYLSQALGRHLSIMCRMYNDYGSAQRDRDECNLNSIDFAEFKNMSNSNAFDGLRSPCTESELGGDYWTHGTQVKRMKKA